MYLKWIISNYENIFKMVGREAKNQWKTRKLLEKSSIFRMVLCNNDMPVINLLKKEQMSLPKSLKSVTENSQNSVQKLRKLVF